jgi:hypothetical protein
MANINDGHGGGARPDHRAPVPVHWDAKAGGSTAYQSSHNLLQAVVSEQGKYLEQIAHMKQDMTPEGYDKQRRAFGSSAAARRVDEAQQMAHNRTAQAADDLDNAVLSSVAQPGTPEAESRAIRTTNRAERVLVSTDDAHGTVRRLIAEAPDAATRGVLAQELPTLAGVDPAFIKQVLIETDPVATARAEELRKCQAAQMIVDADAARVRNGIAEGHTPLVSLTDPVKYDPDVR